MGRKKLHTGGIRVMLILQEMMLMSGIMGKGSVFQGVGKYFLKIIG